MPATSKQQFKFMKAVESGSIKKKGLSKKEAADFTADVPFKKLPKKAKVAKTATTKKVSTLKKKRKKGTS